MNDRRLKKVRDELATLVQKRRRERDLNGPCPACGVPLSSNARIIEYGTEPCGACIKRAEAYDVSLVWFWPPGGPLDTDDDPGDEAA